MNATPPVPDRLPLSVWPTAQDGLRAQRRGRCLKESEAHPAKTYPAIAAHAIASYAQPGDLVVDPMCGIGTTLVEAMRLHRTAIDVEYEKRWADLAVRNVEHAIDQGAAGYSTLVRGDARQIDRLVGADVHSKTALVLTSAPYGPATHGHVRDSRSSGEFGIQKRNYRCGQGPTNLARQSLTDLIEGFAQILIGCRALLRSGGFLVITARPGSSQTWR